MGLARSFARPYHNVEGLISRSLEVSMAKSAAVVKHARRLEGKLQDQAQHRTSTPVLDAKWPLYVIGSSDP